MRACVQRGGEFSELALRAARAAAGRRAAPGRGLLRTGAQALAAASSAGQRAQVAPVCFPLAPRSSELPPDPLTTRAEFTSARREERRGDALLADRWNSGSGRRRGSLRRFTPMKPSIHPPKPTRENGGKRAGSSQNIWSRCRWERAPVNTPRTHKNTPQKTHPASTRLAQEQGRRCQHCCANLCTFTALLSLFIMIGDQLKWRQGCSPEPPPALPVVQPRPLLALLPVELLPAITAVVTGCQTFLSGFFTFLMSSQSSLMLPEAGPVPTSVAVVTGRLFSTGHQLIWLLNSFPLRLFPIENPRCETARCRSNTT